MRSTSHRVVEAMYQPGVPGILLTDPIMDFDLILCTMIHHGEM
jgi:hypothetical protein